MHAAPLLVVELLVELLVEILVEIVELRVVFAELWVDLVELRVVFVESMASGVVPSLRRLSLVRAACP